jgi:hypothetical protein
MPEPRAGNACHLRRTWVLSKFNERSLVQPMPSGQLMYHDCSHYLHYWLKCIWGRNLRKLSRWLFLAKYLHRSDTVSFRDVPNSHGIVHLQDL